MFKKLIASLTLVVLLFSATPKAEAGAGIGFFAGNAKLGAYIGGGIATAFSLVVIADSIIQNTGEGEVTLAVFAAPLLIGLGAILSVEGNQTHKELYQMLQKRYAFIDNPEAIVNLTNVITEKFSQQIEVDPTSSHVYVNLSREEVAMGLINTELTDAQFEQIALELN